MRNVLMLIAVFSAAFLLAAPRAQADAGLEARVLRLEAQVKALQESLKAAVQIDRVYNIRTANPDSCLSGSADSAAAKSEVFLGNCRASDKGLRNWKIGPAQQ
jgi:hypothetical protein